MYQFRHQSCSIFCSKVFNIKLKYRITERQKKGRGGDHVAFFEIFHSQKHFIMTNLSPQKDKNYKNYGRDSLNYHPLLRFESKISN